MKIEQVQICRAAMPLIYPFRTAFGNDDTIESVFVRLSAGNLYGWGEAAPWKYPAYSPECAAALFVVARDFIAPSLLGQDVESGQDLGRRLSGIKGNPFAKAAFDLAWWDLHAKSLGKPLWQVLGGTSPTVDAGADFGIMETIDRLIESIDDAVRKGYKRVKLKYRPGWEIEMVDAVRGAFPGLTAHIDCNSAYTLDSLSMFKKLDRYGLAMIEQPLAHDDLIDHATLQQTIATPVCLDESINSPENARKAMQIKACRWINIKPGRVGGLTHAVAIHDMARDAGVPCWVGGMLESSVGASHCLALATLPNIKYPSDIFPTDRFYRKDLGTPPMQHSGPSAFTAGMQPGCGAEPDPVEMAKLAVERVVLNAT